MTWKMHETKAEAENAQLDGLSVDDKSLRIDLYHDDANVPLEIVAEILRRSGYEVTKR